jgi:hypothetical protein
LASSRRDGGSKSHDRYPSSRSHTTISTHPTRSVSSSNRDATSSHGKQQHSYFPNFRTTSNSSGGVRHQRHGHTSSQHHPTSSFDHDDEVAEDEDGDDDFSPIASDIESDLDILDQSGHEFPDNHSRRIGGGGKKYSHLPHFDDDVPFGVIGGANDDGEKDDDDDDHEEDYLQDVDEDQCMVDGDGEIDMSGL